MLWLVVFALLCWACYWALKALSGFMGFDIVNSLEPAYVQVICVVFSLVSMTLVWTLWQNISFRHMNEHGSARWASRRDRRRLANPAFEKNVLLTQTERAALVAEMGGGSALTSNNNVLVVGATGSGKSQSFIRPQILSAYASYVVTDPKGELYSDTAAYLRSKGYAVRLFSLTDMKSGERYNPLSHVKAPDDALKLAAAVIANTKGSNESGDFWERAETALFEAAFAYQAFVETDEGKKNLHGTLELITTASAGGLSGFGALFEAARDISPFAYSQYSIFRLAPEQTAYNILISAAVRLSAFNVPEIASLTETDTLSMESLGREKSALFIATSDTDTSHNFIAALLYTQLFDTLLRCAAENPDGKLSTPLVALLDEFANIGMIPRFDSLITTVRSRGIAIMPCVQSLSQLKSMYPELWESIAGNCSCLLFLGGMEKSTLEYISEICGQKTEVAKNRTDSMDSTSLSTSTFARDLITPDEVGRIGKGMCILKVAGLQPFLSRKFRLSSHPSYKDYEKSLKG